MIWVPPSRTRTKKLTTVHIFQQSVLSLPDRLPAVTLDKLRLQLVEEESKELKDGGLSYKVSAGTFFRQALEIEKRW